MTNDQFTILGDLTLWVVVKWMLVVAFGLYTAFAAVVVKQVGVMRETIETDLDEWIEMAAWAHFVVAVLLVLAVIVIL